MPLLNHRETQRDGAAIGEVLSFAAVGCHGREWSTLASSALTFLLAAATVRAQPATQDLASEFAGRVAAAIAPGAAVHLVCTGDDGRTQLELGRSLAARGIRLVESGDGATTVRCSCLENLREDARRNAACAAWREGLRVYSGLDQDGKLREDERDDFEEMRTRVASCS